MEPKRETLCDVMWRMERSPIHTNETGRRENRIQQKIWSL